MFCRLPCWTSSRSLVSRSYSCSVLDVTVVDAELLLVYAVVVVAAFSSLLQGRQDLQHISQICWHFLNSGIVMFLDICQHSLVSVSNEVNSNSLTTETSTSTDSAMRKWENVFIFDNCRSSFIQDTSDILAICIRLSDQKKYCSPNVGKQI